MTGDSRHHEPLPVLWDSVRTTSASRDWFSDEAAIDFPSVKRVTERLREAFLGDEHPGVEMLTAEIVISSRDAAAGVVLPLEVPLRRTCGQCGGRGEVWDVPCVPCCGTGAALVHHAVRLSVPPGVTDGARLRFRVASAPVEVTIRRG